MNLPCPHCYQTTALQFNTGGLTHAVGGTTKNFRTNLADQYLYFDWECPACSHWSSVHILSGLIRIQPYESDLSVIITLNEEIIN